LKSSLVVFFIQLFVIHWSLKKALQSQQEKGIPANTNTHKALKTAKITPCLQRDLVNTKRISAGEHPNRKKKKFSLSAVCL
jgi:hypothetical protein